MTREADVPVPLTRTKRALYGTLFGVLTVFWGAGAAVPGPVGERGLAAVLCVSFAYTTWRAVGRGVLDDDEDERARVTTVPAAQQTARGVEELLRARGAPDRCRVHGGRLDGQELDLADALNAIVGSSDGSRVVCIPRRLTYFEGSRAGDRTIVGL